MTKYIVQGGHPLFGEVHISGAKNAAVAIIPAALLVDGVCRIENIPQISDVTALLKILEQLGANVRFLNRSDVEIDCRHIATTQVSQELAHKIRASYYLIGALLGRFGEAEVSMPGGCNFGGVRPIDQHVKGFAAMGAEVLEEMEFQPMFDACKRSLGGKRVALFGSYGWGDGEWMRTWESDCDSAGVNLVCESVICTETPDDAALEACRALGKALVE